MKPLHEVSESIIGQEELPEDNDGLSSEERTQLRELCVLIMISEFLETEKETQKPQTEFHHRDTENTEEKFEPRMDTNGHELQ